MKLLMFYTPSFWYKTHAKSLPDVSNIQREVEIQNCIVVLVQAEEDDPDKGKKVLDKLLKNAKSPSGWLANSKRGMSSFISFPICPKADPVPNTPGSSWKMLSVVWIWQDMCRT
jgi:hypothetical protein